MAVPVFCSTDSLLGFAPVNDSDFPSNNTRVSPLQTAYEPALNTAESTYSTSLRGIQTGDHALGSSRDRKHPHILLALVLALTNNADLLVPYQDLTLYPPNFKRWSEYTYMSITK